MNTEQILKVLKNERECIARQNGKCDRNCAKCDLCLPDDEVLEVYDRLIRIVETDKIIVDIGDTYEERKEFLQKLYDAGLSLHPDLIEKYGIEVKGDTE